MKKIILILVTVILNVFLFSCSPDEVLETLDTQTEILSTDGEDGQTPAEEEDGDD